MFNQSNPLAITSMAVLTAVFLYEYRTVFADGIRRLLNTLCYLIPAIFCLLVFVGAGLLVNWLGWRWLLAGLGRMAGAGFLLSVLLLIWVEGVRPLIQKLSRQWTR